MHLDSSGLASRANQRSFISTLHALSASWPLTSSSPAINAPSGQNGVDAMRSDLSPVTLV